MTDAEGGTNPGQSTSGQSTSGQSNNISALIEAIEMRARQAGSDGAATLLRGMIGSVSEVLGSIQERLDHVEGLLVDQASPEHGLASELANGLQAFNARLGRLEEAFVQAVEDSGTGTDAVVDQVRLVVASLLRDAPPPPSDQTVLDQLARLDAGITRLANADPTRMINTALDAVAERMTTLEERMRLAALSAAEAAPDPAVAIAAQLQPLDARLDAIEALLRDVPEPAPPPAPPDVRPILEEALNPVRAKLTGLEQLIRTRGEERPEQAAALRAALAPLSDRLDGLELAVRESGNVTDERARRMDATVAALPARLSALEATVAKWGEAASGSHRPALDEAVFQRFEGAVQDLERGEAAARVVKLVEERLGAGVKAVADRAEASTRAIDALEGARAEDRRRIEELATAIRGLTSMLERLPEQAGDVAGQRVANRLASLSDRLEGLDARLDGTDARLAGIDENVGALHTRAPEPVATEPGAPVDIDDLVERITGAVRREAELLTQRVAALAVGVEAARSMLEQHVEEAENSIGRKASEVTRRIAADFGIRKAKPAGSRRDPRELGPGAGEKK